MNRREFILATTSMGALATLPAVSWGSPNKPFQKWNIHHKPFHRRFIYHKLTKEELEVIARLSEGGEQLRDDLMDGTITPAALHDDPEAAIEEYGLFPVVADDLDEMVANIKMIIEELGLQDVNEAAEECDAVRIAIVAALVALGAVLVLAVVASIIASIIILPIPPVQAFLALTFTIFLGVILATPIAIAIAIVIEFIEGCVSD